MSYSRLPWSIEETIQNMIDLKKHLQEMVLKRNLDGRGEEDAIEVAFDFERAISALKYQTEQYPKEKKFISGGSTEMACPSCGAYVGHKWYADYKHCKNCGQKIKWKKSPEGTYISA